MTDRRLHPRGSRPDAAPDPAFEDRLRTLMHRTADTVEPDPAGWRRLNGRIRRRRTTVRGGGLALAGAAVAFIAVAVLTTGDDQRVELAPADLAAQPTPGRTGLSTTGGEGSGVPGTAAATPIPPADDVAGGILFSDGDSIHVAGLDGSIRFTPADGGDGTSTITDLDVRPGGSMDDFTMAYRVDSSSDEDECGDISWTRVVGPGSNPDGGGLFPYVDTASSGECLGAPVFASDGSVLAWLADAPDGTRSLQTLDWGDQGPFECCLTTFGIALGDITDVQLVGLELGPAPSMGEVLVRGTGPAGPELRSLPIERQADGALAMPADASQTPVRPEDGIPGTVLDADWPWRAVRLPTEDAEERIGVAYLGSYDPGTGAGGLTAETELLLDTEARPYLDALGGSAVVGVGGTMFLATVQRDDAGVATGIALDALPPATAAVLLPAAEPGPTATPTPSPPADGYAPTRPTPCEGCGATPSSPVPEPTPSPITTATVTPVPQSVPQPVAEAAARLRVAAAAEDWDLLAAEIPTDGSPFTSNFGGQEDHIAFYQQEVANGVDVFGTLARLLGEEPTEDDGGIFVWPREYLGPDYYGYRVGIAADGTWIFFVAGD